MPYPYAWCDLTVTVERAPLVAVRNTQERDWTRAEPHEVARCWAEGVSSSTDFADPRQAATVRAVLYAPAGADIEQGDRIVWEGAAYAVDGTPRPMRSPTGRLDHIECDLVDWRG